MIDYFPKMATDPQIKQRMQVFKNKGKDQDVSIEYDCLLIKFLFFSFYYSDSLNSNDLIVFVQFKM